jgi:succinoglycan biosynthesis protein ExoO
MKPLFRRRFLDAHGLRYRPAYRYAEDFIFYADALRGGAKAGGVETAYYLYTMPLGSLSKAPSGQSKTSIDGRVFLDQLSAFEAAEGPKMTADERRALRACYDARLQHTHLIDFKTHLRQKKVAAALGTLVRHPIILKDMAGVLSRKLGLGRG